MESVAMPIFSMNRVISSRETVLRREEFSGLAKLLRQRVEANEMSAKKMSPIPAEKVEAYEKLVATLPGVERKGADNPYTALNGNMFTLLHGPAGRLAIRLPEDEREKFLKRYKTKLFEAYGAAMREYAAVPDAMLKEPKELQPYFAMSYEYANAEGEADQEESVSRA
jgi:hypothetical protein